MQPWRWVVSQIFLWMSEIATEGSGPSLLLPADMAAKAVCTTQKVIKCCKLCFDNVSKCGIHCDLFRWSVACFALLYNVGNCDFVANIFPHVVLLCCADSTEKVLILSFVLGCILSCTCSLVKLIPILFPLTSTWPRIGSKCNHDNQSNPKHHVLLSK